MPRSKPAATPTHDDPELELLRTADPDFYGDPDYGEVRWLEPGELPEMLVSHGEGLPTGIATWVAEEADGAALGRLALPNVPVAQRPIVMINNEGTTQITGFSWVDHFGASTMAAERGETEALLAFCSEHGLPGPRTAKQIAKLAKTLRLDWLELGAGRVPAIDPAKLAQLLAGGSSKGSTATGAAAATKKTAAKKEPAVAKTTAAKEEPVAKKTSAAAKKTAAKKTPAAAKKTTAKKTPAAAKKTAAKKTPAAAKKTAAKKTPAAAKTATKKTPAAKTTATKKTKKTAAKKTPAANKTTAQKKA